MHGSGDILKNMGGVDMDFTCQNDNYMNVVRDVFQNKYAYEIMCKQNMRDGFRTMSRCIADKESMFLIHDTFINPLSIHTMANMPGHNGIHRKHCDTYLEYMMKDLTSKYPIITDIEHAFNIINSNNRCMDVIFMRRAFYKSCSASFYSTPDRTDCIFENLNHYIQNTPDNIDKNQFIHEYNLKKTKTQISKSVATWNLIKNYNLFMPFVYVSKYNSYIFDIPEFKIFNEILSRNKVEQWDMFKPLVKKNPPNIMRGDNYEVIMTVDNYHMKLKFNHYMTIKKFETLNTIGDIGL